MKYSKVATFVAGVLLAGAAQAAPVFFTTEASFVAALGSSLGTTVTLENYENVTVPGGSATALTLSSGLNIASNTPLLDLDNSVFCAGTSDCLSFSTPPGGSLQMFTFGVGGSVNAFGLFLGDLGTLGGTTLTLFTSSAATQSFVIPSSASANERFFGVIDIQTSFVAAGITNSDLGDFVTIDNTYFGTVPEPSTLLLLGLALLGAGAMRRRVS